MSGQLLPQEQESCLVRQARAGQPAAFACLYERYLDPVYRFVFFRVGDEQLAEDLASETFLKAWDNLDRYQERGLPFGAWLFRIARNLVVDHYRRQKRASPPDKTLDSRPDPAIDVAETVETSLAAGRAFQALAQLTPEQREVLTLKFVEGMSTEDVAQVMRKRPGAIRALQMRGLQALSKLLGIRHE
ncbi:MAG: sigma-70 family RNA polymerase sigma factor [Chloroflexi bacterium]|nr:sigma-70 family RNA polymerase sigma factor [Chloroflexota bacterium]MCI0577026.1 sigma-70 family RNA polymerase sigma factor [Chloroflexota bacterium]MCI0648818.1 sigma-70 family RNA polymerase sigma factor [Chloroflexota bacterium]MCI0726320.1 sigma-70 family RNA polymerase sigma factor [Chloroflexota bacterium]